MQQNIAYKRFVYNVLDKIYATNKGKADPFGRGYSVVSWIIKALKKISDKLNVRRLHDCTKE